MLGHASLPRLQLFDCVKPHMKANTPLCITCSLSKFTKLPFKPSDSHASSPFDLIHIDIWGPYKEKNAQEESTGIF